MQTKRRKLALTSNQKMCLELMRRRHLDFIAATTEQHWREGSTYYIDSRVNARGIRRLFKVCNDEARQRRRRNA